MLYSIIGGGGSRGGGCDGEEWKRAGLGSVGEGIRERRGWEEKNEKISGALHVIGLIDILLQSHH